MGEAGQEAETDPKREAGPCAHQGGPGSPGRGGLTGLSSAAGRASPARFAVLRKQGNKSKARANAAVRKGCKVRGCTRITESKDRDEHRRPGESDVRMGRCRLAELGKTGQ